MMAPVTPDLVRMLNPPLIQNLPLCPHLAEVSCMNVTFKTEGSAAIKYRSAWTQTGEYHRSF